MPRSDDKTREELLFLRDEVRRLRTTVARLSPDLQTLLRRRGFTIFKKEPGDDLLLPSPAHIDRYYSLLHKYSFRLFLRDVIKHQHGFTTTDVARYASVPVAGSYIRGLEAMGLLARSGSAYALAAGPVRSFGTTLEWYVAELFRREFGAEVAWGARFRRPRVGGDYDVLARLDASLIYLETKSSPPKQIYDSEVAAFLDRVDDLAPDVAVFLMDTELRMKDKIVPFFEQELARRYGAPPSVERLERELFHVEYRIFIINAKEELLQNIGKVVEWYSRIRALAERPRRSKKTGAGGRDVS